MKTTHDRHDWIVKLVLGRPANMRSLLQAGLSQETVGRVDWNRMTYLQTEFQLADGTVLRADIIVELPLLGGGRYIAVLEHKSSADSGTRHQVAGYVIAIEREYNAPRMVIPIVLYHGDTPWMEPADGSPAEAWDLTMIVLRRRGSGLTTGGADGRVAGTGGGATGEPWSKRGGGVDRVGEGLYATVV